MWRGCEACGEVGDTRGEICGKVVTHVAMWRIMWRGWACEAFGEVVKHVVNYAARLEL